MTRSTESQFDWRAFLVRWSGEWADGPGEGDGAARRARWLGSVPAGEERIAAMERRLGVRMPPSYREFLAVSDGWRHAGGFVRLLAGTADAHWHDDASGLSEVFEGYVDEDSGPGQRREAGIWRRGLRLDVESDATYVLMDPEDVGEGGEWAVYTWAGWRAAPPERFADFGAFMRDMHREFHRLRARPGEGEPPFVNGTTRALDALVEGARRQALRGDWEGALAALDEAAGYGRPRAAGLGDQIRRLLGRTHRVSFADLVTDPLYAAEFGPVAAAGGTVRPAGGEAYRYTAAGVFGEAVVRARERARWGDTDGAWRALREALSRWEPPGPDHLAPLGWLADPLLGPLLTPARGRELLSTARGGEAGRTPAPTAGLDPDGLAWLADPDGGGGESYRFVLVEGVEPWELPGRLGAGDALEAPLCAGEARMRAVRGRGEASSHEDGPVVAVGRAGGRWSFAFDGAGGPFDRRRFVSPAAAASAGTRAVVVWSGLRAGEAFFHLSVARDGAGQYAFTFADGEVRVDGRVPAALDPARFFAGGAGRAGAERSLLEAVAGEFGVRLPRHALVHGRLHTFTARSWIRPARAGEAYTVIRFRGAGG
ncbi:SMI1/KNR4 family protein [Streptomyces sp. NPDC048507]|uniref:SMI1/KNR4 family protein n=1 Tax=Streptomyces sp. NPDC048507 TaxID=3365560 RepID=UPI0037196E05